jgi:hypothetical protein
MDYCLNVNHGRLQRVFDMQQFKKKAEFGMVPDVARPFLVAVNA